MLFNSYLFLLIFAPVCFAVVFWLGGRERGALATLWLGLASLVFYASWNPWFLPILLTSIVFNYGAGEAISRAGAVGSQKRQLTLALAIAINLLVLGYYKYAVFLTSNFATMTGSTFRLDDIVLPLGISFFTFTQIAYLVDTAVGKVSERNFIRYLLFVSYFPHLIAGPVIHHKDVMPQFAALGAFRFHAPNFAVGLAIFIIGLFKKCFLADNVAGYAIPVFAGVEQGQAFAMTEAWGGTLAYTLQIYFDFSGYSDMAIGLSMMLNVRLPLNFNSPYKARSIIEFWKRWHISLSTFLRDYLYIPLGGNRFGEARRFINLFLTMLIGGLWHGAGWTFVVWGALHGVYLIINHGWRKLRGKILTGPVGRFESALGWGVTLLAVIVAWVFFRAGSFSGAVLLLQGMGGAYGGVTLPEGDWVRGWLWILALVPIALFFPNSHEFVEKRFAEGGAYLRSAEGTAWKAPSLALAAGMGVLAALALMNLLQPAEFLYFNF
jgi:alginate O-acetyltransferase complex protein AlgI